MEWGFQAGTEKTDFDGRLESHMAMIGPISPLVGDKGTAVTGRRLAIANKRGPSRLSSDENGTVLFHSTSNADEASSYRCCMPPTVARACRASDGLDQEGRFHGPPSQPGEGTDPDPAKGVFITKAGSGQTARQFAKELAAKNLKSICR